jgi:hypothetical protein
MAETITPKTTEIPTHIKIMSDIALDILKDAIIKDSFILEIEYGAAIIKIGDIKAFMFKNILYIIYKSIDIVYNIYTTYIKEYKDTHNEYDVYKAHEYGSVLKEIFELAREKVKNRLENIKEIFE